MNDRIKNAALDNPRVACVRRRTGWPAAIAQLVEELHNDARIRHLADRGLDLAAAREACR